MQKLKRFLLNFAGGFIGIAIYQLLTAPMVGGFHLTPSLIAATTLGIIFSIIATTFATRTLHFFISGFATVLIIGGALLLLLGTDTLNTNLSNDGWFEVLSGLVGASFLLGIGGLFATALSPVKKSV